MGTNMSYASKRPYLINYFLVFTHPQYRFEFLLVMYFKYHINLSILKLIILISNKVFRYLRSLYSKIMHQVLK